jgi:hypothetical protein
MALFTNLVSGSASPDGLAAAGITPVVVKHEIDLAALRNITGFATTDQIALLSVPEDTLVLGLVLENATALTNITRLDLGDGGSGTRFVNNATTLTAGTNHAIVLDAPYHYATADTIDLTVGGTIATATGIIRVVAVLADVSRNTPATSPIL